MFARKLTKYAIYSIAVLSATLINQLIVSYIKQLVVLTKQFFLRFYFFFFLFKSIWYHSSTRSYLKRNRMITTA